MPTDASRQDGQIGVALGGIVLLDTGHHTHPIAPSAVHWSEIHNIEIILQFVGQDLARGKLADFRHQAALDVHPLDAVAVPFPDPSANTSATKLQVG